MAPLFPLGQVVATRGAIALMEAARIDPLQLLQRHQSGDWGELDKHDLRENDYAVDRWLRILSAYGQPPDRLWVITEADRSVTTILRPDEY
ncbi:hypothetical protein [Candidatus Nephthysia bennettiae]|uniref:Type I restriction endonuclease subunit M n=1 Tax=Candidatus Nephthysia bennettiae TaxID=3127016 RepID=A0A934NBR4_9BACT|nr:hypothetical protein [Candidatus Dormibacteraeota bacterium]